MSSSDPEGGLQVLLVVRLADTAYFVDVRLRQFRETTNSHNYIDFDSPNGKELCRPAGVATCLRYGTCKRLGGRSKDSRSRS